MRAGILLATLIGQAALGEIELIDRSSHCWTLGANFLSAENMDLLGDLEFGFELGEVSFGDGLPMKLSLEHRSQVVGGGSGMESRWTVTGLRSWLAPSSGDKRHWLTPAGAQVEIDGPLGRLYREIGRRGVMARSIRDGCVEIRCSHGAVFKYCDSRLAQITGGDGTVATLSGRGGLIETISWRGERDAFRVGLTADYDEYGRLVRLLVNEADNRFYYEAESRRLALWTRDERGRTTETVFKYNGLGLASSVARPGLNLSLNWVENDCFRQRGAPSRYRRFRLESCGSRRYDYRFAEGIVRIVWQVEAGARQGMFYNVDTGRMDLLDP